MLPEKVDDVRGLVMTTASACRAAVNLGIGRALYIQIANRQTIDCERVTNPSRERRRELIIKPECHAAAKG